QRVIVHRPVIAAVHVIFARPDHFDWHAGSFGHVDSFADKIRRRIRAATKTTAQQRSVNLHLLRLQSGDASCSHTSNGLESRPRLAAQKPSAITATPEGTSTTLRTPGITFALSALKLLTLPPNTGERATTAVNIPGALTSIPKMPFPFVFSGVSRRFSGLPMSLKSFGSFSATCCGGAIFAALSANCPYDRRRFEALWITIPFSVPQLPASTFQRWAAAVINMARAAAPA